MNTSEYEQLRDEVLDWYNDPNVELLQLDKLHIDPVPTKSNVVRYGPLPQPLRRVMTFVDMLAEHAQMCDCGTDAMQLAHERYEAAEVIFLSLLYQRIPISLHVYQIAGRASAHVERKIFQGWEVADVITCPTGCFDYLAAIH